MTKEKKSRQRVFGISAGKRAKKKGQRTSRKGLPSSKKKISYAALRVILVAGKVQGQEKRMGGELGEEGLLFPAERKK